MLPVVSDGASMQVTIRSIGLEDADGYRAALDAVAREGRFLSRLEAPPAERSLAFVRQNLEAGNPHLLAVDGGAIVGWCDITRGSGPVAAHVGTLGMGLLPAYRGQGIGTRLMERALAEAWARDFLRIELDVYADNAAALALYGKFGFEREGVRRAAARLAGRYRDICLMALLSPRLAGLGG
jgi:RimJ/RimL family protein N-acetyltransferase